MAVVPADAKQVQKRSSVALEVPTVPASNDHTDGSWTAKDIYSGEFFLNETDEKLYIRVLGAIKEISLNGTANTIYSSDDTVGSGRVVTLTDTLDFDGGTLFRLDQPNNGFVYEYSSKSLAIGLAAPTARLSVKGIVSLDIFDFQASSGASVFKADNVGVVTFKTTGGAESIVIQSSGGNTTRISNNSNDFQIRGVGVTTIYGGNGAGAGILLNGFLNASQDYDLEGRTVEIVPNVNAPAELTYVRFESLSGVQKATFGSSVAPGQEFDTWDTFAALSVFHGAFRIETTTGFFRIELMTGAEASLITPGNGDQVYITVVDGTFVSLGFWKYEEGVWGVL